MSAGQGGGVVEAGKGGRFRADREGRDAARASRVELVSAGRGGWLVSRSVKGACLSGSCAWAWSMWAGGFEGASVYGWGVGVPCRSVDFGSYSANHPCTPRLTPPASHNSRCSSRGCRALAASRSAIGAANPGLPLCAADHVRLVRHRVPADTSRQLAPGAFPLANRRARLHAHGTVSRAARHSRTARAALASGDAAARNPPRRQSLTGDVRDGTPRPTPTLPRQALRPATHGAAPHASYRPGIGNTTPNATPPSPSTPSTHRLLAPGQRLAQRHATQRRPSPTPATQFRTQLPPDNATPSDHPARRRRRLSPGPR